MSLIAQRKTFKETFLFSKEIVVDSKKNIKQILIYSLYCFIFMFTSALLTHFGGDFNIVKLQDTAQNIEYSTFNTAEIIPLTINILNSFLSFFILGISSMAFLFFRSKPKSILSSFMQFLSFRFYLNFLLTIMFLFSFIVFVLIVLLPSQLLNVEMSQISAIGFEKIILGFSQFEKLTTVGTLFIILLGLPYFLLGTIIGYMNVMDTGEPILKTYFHTLFNIFKNTFFWVIPFTIYFIFIFSFYNGIKIVNPKDTIDIAINSFMASLFWGYGGYIIFSLKEALYPEDNFNPIEDDINRIIAKQKK